MTNQHSRVTNDASSSLTTTLVARRRCLPPPSSLCHHHSLNTSNLRVPQQHGKNHIMHETGPNETESPPSSFGPQVVFFSSFLMFSLNIGYVLARQWPTQPPHQPPEPPPRATARGEETGSNGAGTNDEAPRRQRGKGNKDEGGATTERAERQQRRRRGQGTTTERPRPPLRATARRAGRGC